MLRIENLNVSIAAVHILRGVSLELPTGSMIGLIGRNGAGKTTLMKTIMGILKPSGGSLRFDDTDLAGVPNHARARIGIGYMPEDRRLIPDLTVEENVLLPAWATGARDARERLAKVYRLVPEVKEFGPRKGSQLSGGQQKLVAPALAQRLAEVVAGLKKEGMSVMLTESDLQHSERLVDRVIPIDRGAIAL